MIVWLSVPLSTIQCLTIALHIHRTGNSVLHSIYMNTVTYVEIKCQLDLIACSTCFGHYYAHHQELKSIMQLLLLVVFHAVVFQVAGLVRS